MTDLIVDGNSLYARSWYAAQTITTDPAKTLQLAAMTVLGLINPVSNQIGTRFDRTLFCWDWGSNESKHREPKPPEYYEFRTIAKDLFALLLGTANAEIEPYEGDDLVASAVCSAAPGTEIIIASGDKDLMQLAYTKGNISYYSLNDKCVLSETFICNKFHVKQPCQIALALAIQGDAVDCIPGVRGWGPVKVKNLFKEIGKEMTFEQAMRALAAKMNPRQHDEFMEALGRTLLAMDIPVPAPAPIVFADTSDVAGLGMPDVTNRLRELRYLYEDAYDLTG